MNNLNFRAWDFENNVMVYGVGLTPSSDNNIPYLIDEESGNEDDNITYFPDSEVMQDTGIKDKKGNKIYVGDILEWRARDLDNTLMRQRDVVTSEKGFFAVGNDCLCDPAHLDQVTKQSTVIGNVYEDPELISNY